MPRPARTPRKVTATYLNNAALAYLGRYSSSAENLRRVLRRKVERACRLREEDVADYAGLVDEAVARCLASGLLDDRVYAEGKVASLRRRGGSARGIAAKLASRGVDKALVAAALAGNDADDRDAALAYARRRRLGPFRAADREAHRDRDLASLGRAGFSFAVSRAVIDEAEG